MSHTVTCAVEMRDIRILERAAEHLNLTLLGVKTHKLFNGQDATGLGIKLPEWKFPIVVDVEKGKAVYDNYNGSWGKQVELDKLVQRYAIEAAYDQAAAEGYSISEQLLANGDMELTAAPLLA